MTRDGVKELTTVLSSIVQVERPGQGTCPRSHGDEEAELGSAPRWSGSRICDLNHSHSL